MTSSVMGWPAYVLRRTPPDLRLALSLEAAELDYSIADLIRNILCDHYQLDCPRRLNKTRPIGYGSHGGEDGRAEDILLRLQPELWDAIRAEAGGVQPMRTVMVGILTAHYKERSTA